MNITRTLLLSVVLLNVLDIITTNIAISVGLCEGNPLAAQRDIILKIAFPLILSVFWVLAWNRASKEDATRVKVALLVVLIGAFLYYVVVVTWNISLVMLKVRG